MHVAGSIRVIFVAKLVVHALDLLLGCFVCQSELLVVIYFYIEVVWVGLLSSTIKVKKTALS